MENLSMCRICLATDVRLCSIASPLRDMYERITAMTFKREDKRPLVACYICHAKLQSCYRLRMSCLRGEDLLTEMMSSGELNPQDVLSTNTLSIVSVLQLSLGHELQVSTECHIKEEEEEIIHNAELDQNNAEDIKIEPQEEYDSHIKDPLDVIKCEPDDIETDDEDTKLEIEDTILEENELDVADSCSQLAENICPKIVKIVLQRIDENYITTDVHTSKKNKIAALEHTEDTTTNKRKEEKNEGTEDTTIKEPKFVTKKTTVAKPVIQLNKCENVVTSIVNNVCEERSTNNTSLEHNVSSISISENDKFLSMTKVVRTYGRKSFATKESLKTLIGTHTSEKPFRCIFCNKCFTQKSILDDHIRIHTGEKPCICNVCKEGFNCERVLDYHIRIHTGEEPYICNVCKKCFALKYQLKSHIRIHTGEVPFRCNYCNKGFASKQNLITHIRIHTGEQPYICNICKKGFTAKHRLKIHIRTHTGEKPFRCNYCKKGFTEKTNLERHIRIHTGEKPFRCNDCKKRFYSED